jgi:hypothetical protein
MYTVICEIGLFLPGYTGGLVPELRLGLVRVIWCRGSMIERLRSYQSALMDAVRGVGA